MFFKKGTQYYDIIALSNVLNMQKMKKITNIYRYYHSFLAQYIMQNMCQWK
jgi:hypothetical protein